MAPAMLVDMAMASTDVKTIDIKEEDDAKLPNASTGAAMQTPHKVAGGEERSRSGADVPGNTGSRRW